MAVRLRGWWRLLKEPINATIDAPLMGGGVSMAGDVHIAFTLDENATTDEKFAQIQGYVREPRAMFGPINAAIKRIDDAIEQAKQHADAVAAQALTDAKAEVKRLAAQLNEVQAVDLRIAALGAFIMADGYVLGYFSCFR